MELNARIDHIAAILPYLLMKYTIFADTHLSATVDEHVLGWLKYVIDRATRVIINGDFWDKHVGSFDDFIHSGWSELFLMLHAKQTIYIVGNHDEIAIKSNGWQQFAVDCRYAYEFKSGPETFIVEHGHRFSNAFDKRHPTMISKFGRWFDQIDSLEESEGLRSVIYKSYMSNEKLERQTELQQYAKRHLQKNSWRVFAHTHLRCYDPVNRYLNPGNFGKGKARWLEIEQGKITFFEENMLDAPSS